VTLDGLGWPQIDIEETHKEVRITAELPGLDDPKDSGKPSGLADVAR
jgi:HSP20 family protein